MVITANPFDSKGRLSTLAEIAEGSTAVFEWSLSVSFTQCEERERCVVWLQREPDEPALQLDSLSAILKLLNCPQGFLQFVKESQNRILAAGLACDQRGVGVLYLHCDVDDPTKRYCAYRWDVHDAVSDTSHQVSYQCSFLPETYDSITPHNHVHAQYRELFKALTQTERVRQLSTFWLRHRAGRIDQVCLTFSWMPKLDDYFKYLEPYCGARIGEKLRRYGRYRFRHLAFSGEGRKPSMTLYFSGDVPPDLSWSFHELQLAANRSATHTANTLQEDVLSKTISPRSTHDAVDLASFYNTQRINAWKQVLGPELIYHHGQFADDEAPDPADDAPFVRSVKEVARHIDDGSRVYDLGCGWGGVGRYLTRQKQCRVLGLTISRDQYRYCHHNGSHVRLGDMVKTLPPGFFNVALLMESLEHVADKFSVLRNLRLFCDKLVIRTNCQDRSNTPTNFAESMVMVSASNLKHLIEQAGWRIEHWQNIRPQTLKSLLVWRRRLTTIPFGDDEHLEAFREHCERTSAMLTQWGECNPLIEVVAK